jgi:hypothetical protein
MKYATLILMCLLAACEADPRPTAIPPLLVTTDPVTCDHTISWRNPTHNVYGSLLAPDELTKATLYVAAAPYAGSGWDRIIGVPPYILTVVVRDVPSGVWYFELTVSNLGGESGPASVTSEFC